MGDRLAAHLAHAVVAGLHALERFFDLVERVLLLREEREGEVAVVGVAPGVRLVHAEGARLAPFRPRAEGVLGDAVHGVENVVAQRQQAFALLERKGVCLPLLAR